MKRELWVQYKLDEIKFIARCAVIILPSIGEEVPIEIFNSRRDLYLSALGAYNSRLDYDKLVSPRGRAIVYVQICSNSDAGL